MKRNDHLEAKRNEKIEAKRSEKIGPVFSLEHAKTKRNGSRFASKGKIFYAKPAHPNSGIKIVKFTVPVFVFPTRDAPDNDFTNLKARFRISGAGRIPDIRPDSTFKYLVKSEINKSIRCIDCFLSPYLTHVIFYTNALPVTVVRRHTVLYLEIL
jgi:hypothetical protein